MRGLKYQCKCFLVFHFLVWSAFAQGTPIRILSIDGGGVRGIIAAVILEAIEKEIGQPISEVFDFIAGSSTGGMIALALSSPNEAKKPIKTASAIVESYLRQSANFFHASWVHKIRTIGGLIGPKYQSEGLENFLRSQLGNTMLSEAIIPTLIIGYYLEGETGVEFFSEDAKKFPQDKDCLMREVALATAAAPVYFEPVDIQYAWGKLESVTDGGLYKSNPALLAYLNATKLFPDQEIEVFSVGTGHACAEELQGQLKGRGLLQWIFPIIPHLISACKEADDATLHRILNEGGRQKYFRLNVYLDKPHDSMVDISDENLNYLYNKGVDATKSTMFNSIIKRLRGQ